jgi:hypothetical protein
MRPDVGGTSLGKDENGQDVWQTQFLVSKLESRVELVSGRAVAARGVETQSPAGRHQTLVLVSARLLEPEAGKGK